MNIVNKDSKNTFTRMCIGEAIIKLLKDTDFDKIRITSVAKCAGVSRITFYKYYESIHDALCDYLNIIIIEYLEECANHLDKQTGQHQNERTLNEILFFLDYSHILFALEFFNRYKDYFLTLSRCGLHSILINSINNFMSEHFTNPKNYSEYRLYCYSGGLLNTFLKWEENGCDCDAGEIARTLEELYS